MQHALTLWLDSTRAMLAPRRLLPLLLVSAAMVWAQGWYSRSWLTDALAVGMCLFFALLGPFSWRLLSSTPGFGARWALRALAFVGLGAFGPALAWALPQHIPLERGFLTSGVNAVVVTTLFWAGAWGLARDIDLEREADAQRARADALMKQTEQAQLLALQAHLDPHFLFNTLNAIAEWCREDGAVAERALLELSALLREVMQGVRQERWPLERELALLRRVWELHRVRDPERFVLDWQLEEGLEEVTVPPMLLLPLGENAVKHGPGKGHRGALSLRIQLHEHGLTVRLSNPGPLGSEREGAQGLAVLRQRLELSYKGDAALTLEEREGRGGSPRTVATLSLPRSPR